MAIEQGAALLAAGRYQEALAAFGAALRTDPASLEARLGLAQACVGAGDPVTAIAWLSDACRVAPADAALQQQLAELLLTQHQYAQALPLYQRLYDHFKKRDRATLLHLGYCLEHCGALDEAVARYCEAVAGDPSFLEAHVDLAGVLWRVSDFEGALAHARRAVALAPEHPYAVRVLGAALLNLNRLQEAEAELRRALALQPGFELAELDLAFVLLLAGRLEEGWPWYARRWRDTQRLHRPSFFQPALEWQGRREQPLGGKRIAVYAEQGLGDVLQFIRYVPLLQAEGAAVVCVVQPELASLIERSFPGVQCLRPGLEFQVDCHVALLDLPLHFGTTLASIPADVPYLRASNDALARWQTRLAPWGDRFRVGLCWSGSPLQVNNRNRAVNLSQLALLLRFPGVQCFSLQKGDAGAFTDWSADANALVDLTGEWESFDDSAAMLQGLDLVVTVDTAMAHLAGGLGRPAWVMLPPNADWRWLLERDDSPWYPTLRLFRRDFGESRQAQVARVVSALAQQRAQDAASAARRGDVPVR